MFVDSLQLHHNYYMLVYVDINSSFDLLIYIYIYTHTLYDFCSYIERYKIYIHIYTSTAIHVYVYIKIHTHVQLETSIVYIYIYMYTYLYSHCVYTCIMDTYVSWIHMYTLCMYTCPLPQKKIQHICDGIRQVAGETPASRKGSATDRRTPGDPKKKRRKWQSTGVGFNWTSIATEWIFERCFMMIGTFHQGRRLG